MKKYAIIIVLLLLSVQLMNSEQITMNLPDCLNLVETKLIISLTLLTDSEKRFQDLQKAHEKVLQSVQKSEQIIKKQDERLRIVSASLEVSNGIISDLEDQIDILEGEHNKTVNRYQIALFTTLGCVGGGLLGYLVKKPVIGAVAGSGAGFTIALIF